MSLLRKLLASILSLCLAQAAQPVFLTVNQQQLIKFKPQMLSGCDPRKKALYDAFFKTKVANSADSISISAEPNEFQKYQITPLRFSKTLVHKTPFNLHVETRNGFFSGQDLSVEAQTTLITSNFAADQIFRYYKSPCLAQDELQVCEAPQLGLIREYMRKKFPQYLSTHKNSVIVDGVKRVFHFETQGDILKNTPVLYGRNFRKAKVQTILRATRPLKSPLRMTILTVVAPYVAKEKYYKEKDVGFFLLNTTIGFTHAKRLANKKGSPRLLLHTGRLGAGAFGNNITLSLLIQLIAAYYTASTQDGQFDLVFFDTTQKELEYAKVLFEEFRTLCARLKPKTWDGINDLIMKLVLKYNLVPHQGRLAAS